MRPIEDPRLWNKFKGKFGWRVQQPEPIYLEPVVQPITLIDDLMKRSDVLDEQVNITGTGLKTFLKVPDGYRYHLSAYWALLMNGTFLFDRIYIQKNSIPVTLMKSVIGQTEMFSGVISPLVLDAGSELAVWVSGYTATGFLKCKILVMVEEVK